MGSADIGIQGQSSGSTVDLPATILDLLEIDTNATFMVGKSLLSRDLTPEYFISRDVDVDAEGRTYYNSAADCEKYANNLQPSLPLDSCEKRSLLQALRSAVANYSQRREQVLCDTSKPLAAQVNTTSNQVSISVSDLNQMSGFSRKGASVDAGQDGIWALSLESTGHVMSRRFYLPSEAESLAASIRSQPGTVWLIVIDLPNEASELPPALAAIQNSFPSKSKAIALIDASGEIIEVGSSKANSGDLRFSLDRTLCVGTFSY